MSTVIEKSELVKWLSDVLPKDAILYRDEDLRTYECDGLTVYRGMPLAVVFPHTTEEVSEVVKLLHKHEIPFIPRGAGTGLSGGATPYGGEVIISLVRMKGLLSVDYENREAVVQPGYINLKLSNSISHRGIIMRLTPQAKRVVRSVGMLRRMRVGLTV